MKKFFTVGLAALALSACGEPTLEEQVLSTLDDTLKEFEILFSQEEVCVTELTPSSEKLESLVGKLETDTDGNPPENVQNKLLETKKKMENLMNENIGKLNSNC